GRVRRHRPRRRRGGRRALRPRQGCSSRSRTSARRHLLPPRPAPREGSGRKAHSARGKRRPPVCSSAPLFGDFSCFPLVLIRSFCHVGRPGLTDRKEGVWQSALMSSTTRGAGSSKKRTGGGRSS